jgi:hypothetical protein
MIITQTPLRISFFGGAMNMCMAEAFDTATHILGVIGLKDIQC